MDTEENDNFIAEATGSQTASAEIDPGKVRDAAVQLQASVSRFAQEAETNQQSLVALIQQVSGQLQTIGAEVQKDRAQIDKLTSWIGSNRR
jgi:hypothetical protein